MILIMYFIYYLHLYLLEYDLTQVFLFMDHTKSNQFIETMYKKISVLDHTQSFHENAIKISTP